VSYQISHFDTLEAESIHIIREAVAESERPVRTTAPLFFDEYRKNRQTGSFILIDEATNNTVGAGIIGGAAL